MRDVVDIYLHDPRAEKYRAMDRKNNNGHLPEKTVLYENICFCLVKPTFDQCADPIYTMVRANLPVWHKERTPWHKQSACGPSCACSQGWFQSISRSERDLVEGLLCKPVACPTLMVESDRGQTPEFHKPRCASGAVCGDRTHAAGGD